MKLTFDDEGNAHRVYDLVSEKEVLAGGWRAGGDEGTICGGGGGKDEKCR